MRCSHFVFCLACNSFGWIASIVFYFVEWNKPLHEIVWYSIIGAESIRMAITAFMHRALGRKVVGEGISSTVESDKSDTNPYHPPSHS